MTETRTLYQILEIKNTATPEEIRAAYILWSKLLHPDKQGGNAEQFMEVKQAYEVLSDSERRVAYDETGIPDNDPKINNLETNAMNFILSQVQLVIDNQNLSNLERIDLCQLLKNMVQKNLEEAQTTIKMFRAKLARIELMASKIVKKGDGENVIRRALERQAAQFKEMLVMGAKEIAVKNFALELIDQYQYDFESLPKPQAGEFGFHRLGSWNVV